MGASRSSTAALRTPCLTTHLIFAMKDRGTRKKSEGSSPHLLPSPGKRVGENDSFLSRPFWPCLDYSCRIVDSRNSLSLLLKHAKKIFLLFLYNSTYVLFWPPANQRESWKLDGSYFKSSDLTSTLLLGLCLSFWDINCTDIGVGQLCGLSLCVCQSFSCVQLLQPRGLYPTRLPVHGILQARILEWVAVFFSRGSSRPRNRTQVSCIAGKLFTIWATRDCLFLLVFWPHQPTVTCPFSILSSVSSDNTESHTDSLRGTGLCF